MLHGDYVEGALGATETTETSLGSITIPSGGPRTIVGMWAIINGIQTTAEYISGTFRLAFSNNAGKFKFPASSLGSGAGTLAGGAVAAEVRILPCNIPVKANEVIDCFATMFQNQTGAMRAAVGILYEGE